MDKDVLVCIVIGMGVITFGFVLAIQVLFGG